MKLRRVELTGFKSFPRTVHLEFDAGITAIVGPNGCGKSNIVDALRWVLGEQNPRTLRGERMEDTIFKGTAERKPLNMAEVTVTLTNDPPSLPVDFSEVAITRRLFRSGESHYLLNKEPCRLKDITDLILDTGIGFNAYSLIEQRMVDAILDDDGEYRRQILEEAAGVMKYKQRRRATERKLEATAQDLLRLQDILAEVERSVAHLKRHVARARRYERYRRLEVDLEGTLALRELGELAGREAPLAERSRSLAAERQEREAQLSRGEAALAALRESLDGCQEGLRGARARWEGARGRLRDHEAHLLLAREREQHARARAAEIGREMEALRARRAGLEAEAGGDRGALEGLRARREEFEAAIAARESDLGIASEGARVGEVGWGQAEARRVEALMRLAEGEARLRALEGEMAEARARAGTMADYLALGAQEVARLQRERGGLEAEMGELRGLLEGLQGDLRQLAVRAAGAEQERERAEELRKEQELRWNNAAALADAQRVLESRHAGYLRGAAYVMENPRRFPAVRGTVADLLVPDPSCTRAIERALGDALSALVVEDLDAALEAMWVLREERRGRVILVPLDLLGGGAPLSAPSLPEGAIRATALVDCPAGLEPLREALLGDLLLFPDARACEAHLRGLPRGVRAASLDGEILVGDGRLIAGSPEEEDALLSRRRRLEELEEQGRQLLREVEAAAARAEGAREALAGIARHRQQVEEQSVERTNAVRERERIAAGLGAEMESRQRERERLEGELGGLEARIRQRQSEAERVRGELARGREALAALEAEALQRRGAAGTAREEREAIVVALSDLRAERAALFSRASEMERLLQRTIQERVGIEGAMADREAERTRLMADLAALAAEQEETASGGEAVRAEVEALETAVRSEEATWADLQRQVRQAEEALSPARQRVGEIREEVHRLELEEAEIRMRRESLLERLRREWEVELLPEPRGFTPLEGESDRLRADMEGIRRRMRALGPVNLGALEEYEREKERLDFLMQQRDDLASAKAALEEAIRRINRTAREMLQETFGRVQANFRTTFRTLFEGGIADIVLREGEDPLEALVEVIAQPEGKKVQTLDLLSGGERALTALAFLFAIYLVKPSPFCVFDEVDAPLDDANILRFVRMLREFSRETQFVVITHNKRTMESADYLYGVTMEEAGISQLVSVRLNGRERAGEGAAISGDEAVLGVGGGAPRESGDPEPRGGDGGE